MQRFATESIWEKTTALVDEAVSAKGQPLHLLRMEPELVYPSVPTTLTAFAQKVLFCFPMSLGNPWEVGGNAQHAPPEERSLFDRLEVDEWEPQGQEWLAYMNQY